MIAIIWPISPRGTVMHYGYGESAQDYRGPVLSVSSEGVRPYWHLTEIPAEMLDAAQVAYNILSRDPFADVSHLATHVSNNFEWLIPIKKRGIA